jgi:hypothetical protein
VKKILVRSINEAAVEPFNLSEEEAKVLFE